MLTSASRMIFLAIVCSSCHAVRRRSRCPWFPSCEGHLRNGRGGIRTHTPLRAGDFKSPASAFPPLGLENPCVRTSDSQPKGRPQASPGLRGRIISNRPCSTKGNPTQVLWGDRYGSLADSGEIRGVALGPTLEGVASARPALQARALFSRPRPRALAFSKTVWNRIRRSRS